MLPTVISSEIEEGIKSFLRTTFPPSTPAFEHTLNEFLGKPGQVFKGPYYGLRLPFRPASSGPLPFREIKFPYSPYLHQARALARLCGEMPQSTVVATGTGSGKTECFLFPILDHCAAHIGEHGIKAIVIYPMNALATDQAKRFAETIHSDEKLRGKVTAGLFIGDEGDETLAMTEKWLITHKGQMTEHPPDVLLTNYKMLDYLLLRPAQQGLWRYNAPETLRYLVVDELHSFDGAQATDLACLIRRLKARLRTPSGRLVCVGTSATLGGVTQPLVEYAGKVFAEPFENGSVIGEDLLTLGDVVEGRFIRYHRVPAAAELMKAASEFDDAPHTYLAEQYSLWFGAEAEITSIEGRLALGERLREHSFFRNLLMLAERSGRKILSEEWLAHGLSQMLGAELDGIGVRRLLDSFLSLCVHSRYTQVGPPEPLLRVHVHLWMRELSRLVASVGLNPGLAFSDDLKDGALSKHLPVLHCRDCGAMGWGGTMRANSEKVSHDLGEFYRAFFNALPSLRFFFPVSEHMEEKMACGEFTHALCSRCLAVNAADVRKCSHCGAEEDELVRVLMWNRTRRAEDRTEADRSCPYCESASGLTILGSRAASLTSVALSQLYTSPFNPEKKALAFSDNVQDASHRSGFFTARTYRVNLRTAIRRALGEAGATLTLAQLETWFLKFWKGKLGELDFIGLFVAPSMEWLDDFEHLRRDGKLPSASDLARLVERRTAWEITAEFGFNCRIGRTLEKSGAAIAYVESEPLAVAASQLLVRLREKAGGFGSVSIRDVTTMLMGLLHRLRTNGGVYHPEIESYVSRGGDAFLLNQSRHMPHFGRRAEMPVFFTMGHERMVRFEKLVAGGTNLSWSQRYTVKALRSIPGLGAEAAAFVIEEAIDSLSDASIVAEREVRGNRVWGISGEHLLVTAEVSGLACRQCGHLTSCSPVELNVWEEAPCLRASCSGSYGTQPLVRDYYGDLYRSGDVIRIRSAEHTGLLDREEREWIENRFMSVSPERRSTDPNLLSCTPTLEMGVNIGDLASVVLCSVPPATSNYVQRVGRAGRKEGAAVSLTIASAQPHDLYYFEQPEDMMAGEIRPPGTFLNAPAVLERQLTAYCLDRWSEQTNPRPILPHRLEPVLDTVHKPEGKQGFPYDFFHFVESNLAPLLAGFLSLFAEIELTLESRSMLDRFARGSEKHEGLTLKILKRLTRLVEERDDLRNRLQRIGRAIRKNRETTARDEALEAELDELKQHRDGLHEMLKQINGKLTLNFFTDEGLLPNYAFPEEGVELRSVILKKRDEPKPDEAKYRTITFEYVRPGAAAITELAPGNVFYVQGRCVRVDQVGMGMSKPETWHFCDACGYMEMLTENGPGRDECPACGSANWTDTSLKRELVRLRQVIATTSDRRSRSHDEKDERELEFYNRHESVVIPQDAEREAYQISGGGVPFGFEFLGKLTLRVVNLGQDSPEIHAFRLGGREVSSGGFVLCPDCGKVQGRRSARGEEEMKHDLSCRHRGKDTAPLQAVFLYRELHSEAIRVLLPSTSPDEDAAMASFVAAVHLGLRLYFRGSIEHLHGCVDERPVPGTSLRRKYLVLYDQVPGGTGYLKELSQKPETFLEVLRLAHRHLRDCECQTRIEHAADGCHRCILQSRRRRNQGKLSRTTAIRLLETILENAGRIERVDRVSDIDIHPLIQSELEKSFLESLRAVPGAQLQPKIVRGKPGYLWRCAGAAWEVGLQVAVDGNAKVKVASIPDFVLYPVRAEASRPMAVFLDGFAFHADETNGHNRVAKDVQQRQALISSGAFWVWSFSWEDIQFRNDPSKIPATPLGEAQAVRRNILAEHLLTSDELALAQISSVYSSWSLFIEFLGRPAEKFWTTISQLYALHLPAALQRIRLESAIASVQAAASEFTLPPELTTAPEGDGVGAQFGDCQIAGVVLVTLPGVRERNPAGVFAVIRFDDDVGLLEQEFARHWRGFLRLLNLLQFLPNAHFVTVRGCRAGEFHGLVDAFHYFLAGGEPHSAPPERPPEVELAQSAVLPLLEAISERNLPRPAVGFELEFNGMIAGMAELAWPEKQIAVLEGKALPDREAFAEAGWQVFIFSAQGVSEADISAILKLLSTVV
jgi:DEAD/DEAH box helicase domain-containing protein